MPITIVNTPTWGTDPTPPTYAYTGQDRWLVDGYDLKTYAFNITKVDMNTPELRGGHSQIPQRSGVIPRFNRSYEAGEFSLQMWVGGCDTDGSPPGPYSQARKFFDRNLHFLLSLFDKQGSPLQMQRLVRGTEWRTAQVLRTGSVSVEEMMSRMRAEFTATFQVLNAFWESPETFTSTSPADATLPKTVVLTDLVGASAPVEDAVVQVEGPITNPVVTCPETGVWFSYNTNLNAGQTLTVDANTWTAKVGTVNVVERIRHGGHARWVYLPPRGAGAGSFAPTLTLTGSGGGSTTRLSVSYKRKYLVG